MEKSDFDNFIEAMRDAIQPKIDEDNALWERFGGNAVAAFNATGAILTYVGGNCPVQADGQVDGYAFYFRARGGGWQFHVAPTADDIFTEREVFYIEREYGDGPFDAGWMPLHEAYGFIVQAISEFRATHA